MMMMVVLVAGAAGARLAALYLAATIFEDIRGYFFESRIYHLYFNNLSAQKDDYISKNGQSTS